MAKSHRSLIGEGLVFVGLRSGGKMRQVGNVKEFKLDITEETKEMQNYMGGGGLADQVSRISKVEASFNFLSLSGANFAMALRGDDSVLAAGTVTAEAHNAYRGGLIPLAGIAPTSVTVTVNPEVWVTGTAYVAGNIVKPTAGTHFYKVLAAGTSGVTEPTWNTDGSVTSDDGTLTWTDMGTMILSSSEITIRGAGIFIPEDSVKIADAATPVLVTYTKTAGTIIEALINSPQEYRIIFDGTNLARNGDPLVVELFNAKFSPAKSLSFIGDDFSGLELTASVIKDDTKTGAGISAFCNIRMTEE